MTEKINIGVIGLGGRGRYFCELYGNSPRSQLIAVCDLSPQRLELVRNRWGSSLRYFTDMNDMLAMPGLDAVIVATDDPHHTEPTVAALRAGKHVMVEKPLAQTVTDCQFMVEEAGKAKGIFMIGLELRHCILFERVRALLDEGAIGKVLLGWAIDNVSVGGNYFYHNRARRKNYIKSLLIQKACHSLDLLNWFMGGRPQQVFAYGALSYYGGSEPNDKHCQGCERAATCPFFVQHNRFTMDYGAILEIDDLCVWAEGCDVPDNSVLTISYDNGTRATFTECHFTPEYSREFTFVGDKGKLYALYNNEGNFLIRVQHRFSDHVDEYRPIYTGGHHGGGDLRIMEEFLDCIESGRQPRASLQAAYDSTVLAICAEESIETGRPIDIPLIPTQ
ncbi:MAG: Gfo/Idh/MocA family protein [Anaerolineae bacterium]